MARRWKRRRRGVEETGMKIEGGRGEDKKKEKIGLVHQALTELEKGTRLAREGMKNEDKVCFLHM